MITLESKIIINNLIKIKIIHENINTYNFNKLNFLFVEIFYQIKMSIVWPPDATLLLIRLRREYHAQFELAANRDYAAIWSTISLRIIIALNFIVTGRQCQIKWQALKNEYENAS